MFLPFLPATICEQTCLSSPAPRLCLLTYALLHHNSPGYWQTVAFSGIPPVFIAEVADDIFSFRPLTSLYQHFLPKYAVNRFFIPRNQLQTINNPFSNLRFLLIKSVYNPVIDSSFSVVVCTKPSIILSPTEVIPTAGTTCSIAKYFPSIIIATMS